MKPYYQHAGITIYHGDCRDILPNLKGIDLCITSPPYNVNNPDADLGNGRNWPASKWIGTLLKNGYGSHGDNMPWAEYEAVQRDALSLMWGSLAEDGAIFYNHKPRVRGENLWTPLSLNPGLPVRQIITWQRAGGVNFSVTHYLPTFEWIIIFAKPKFRLRDQSASGVGDCWYMPQVPDRDHPATFPITLPIRSIETTRAGLVLDPFCGSGTTLQAAKKLGRKAIGIEIEERYCEIAARRLSQEVLPFSIDGDGTGAA